MLYVQSIGCAFVSVVGEVRVIEKSQESDLEPFYKSSKATEALSPRALHKSLTKTMNDEVLCLRPDYVDQGQRSVCAQCYWMVNLRHEGI